MLVLYLIRIKYQGFLVMYKYKLLIRISQLFFTPLILISFIAIYKDDSTITEITGSSFIIAILFLALSLSFIIIVYNMKKGI